MTIAHMDQLGSAIGIAPMNRYAHAVPFAALSLCICARGGGNANMLRHPDVVRPMKLPIAFFSFAAARHHSYRARPSSWMADIPSTDFQLDHHRSGAIQLGIF